MPLRFLQWHRDISHVRLVVISKDDCPLCDEALAVIESVRQKHPFKLDVVKMEPGDEWYERYWDMIPVGLVNDKMIFKYRIKPEDLLTRLRARAGK